MTEMLKFLLHSWTQGLFRKPQDGYGELAVRVGLILVIIVSGLIVIGPFTDNDAGLPS